MLLQAYLLHRESFHFWAISDKVLLCRMHKKTKEQWANLPPEMVLLVIQKLVLAAGNKFSAALNLRLVCKAWHAASIQHPAALLCRDIENLDSLCSAFPGLGSLRISALDYSASRLEPLISCTQLRSISLDYTPDQCKSRYLPASLAELSLRYNQSTGRSYAFLPELEPFSCETSTDEQEDVIALLQGLSNLEVNSLYYL